MGLSEHYSNEIARLSRQFFDARHRVRELYPSLPIEGDSRLTVFNACHNLLDGVGLGVEFHRRVLCDPGFFKPEVPRPDARVLRIQFLSLMLMSLSNGLFMAQESTLRELLRAIDPNACNRGTGKYHEVYKALLSPLGLRQKWTQFLRLFSEVRNTVHNGFVYYNDNGADKTLPFEGKDYVFRHAKPVDFANWDLTILLSSRVCEMLEEVVTHPAILRIPRVLAMRPPV